MLKSYEAIYENGQLKWLKDNPPIKSARVIVTILEENSPPIKSRTSPDSIVDEEERESSLLNVLATLPTLDEEFPDIDTNLPPLEDVEF